MRNLLTLFAFLLGASIHTVFAVDTTPPTCKIVDSVISGSPGGGTTYFTFYIKADDETALRSPYAIEYRARVNDISNDQAGFGAWAPFSPYDSYTGPLTITVQCTSFQFEVRAVDAAGNHSPSVVRRFAAPFPITPAVAAPRFSAAQKLTTGGTTVKRVLAKFDFDGDGTVDVVEADHDSGILKVRRNTEGDGKTFTDLDLTFPAISLNSVAAGKLMNKAGGTTNDDLPDLAVAANGSITVESNGGVTAGVLGFTAQAPGLFMQDAYIDLVAVEDLNGDGFGDIVAAGTAQNQPGKLAIFLNQNGTSGGFAAPIIVTSALDTFYDIQIADLNGDSYPDVAVTGYDGNGVPLYEIFVNDGAGHLTSKESGQLGSYPLGGYPTSFALADVTGDGVPDLVIAVSRTFFTKNPSQVNPKMGVEILRNKGDGTFTFLDQYPLLDKVVPGPARIFHASVVVGDTNFDGKADIVAACELSNIGKLYQPKIVLDPDDGSLFAFSLARSSSLIFGGPVQALAFGDLDGNGKRDLFSANTLSANQASVLLNLSPGVTVPSTFKFTVTGDTKPLDGFISGWDFNFSTVLAASAAGLKLRVQSTLDPTNEGSWTDLPGGGYLTKSGVNNWKLTATDIPLGMRYFRVIASSDDFSDKITKSIGPINITTPVYNLAMKVAEVTDDAPKVKTTGFKSSYTLKVDRGSTGLLAVQVTNTGSIDKFNVQVPRRAMGEHFRTLASEDVEFGTYVMPALPADDFVTLQTPTLHHNGTYTFYLKGRVAVDTPKDEIGSLLIAGEANANANASDSAEAKFQATDPKNTFFVTNTNDDFNAGSLRKALLDLQAHNLKAKTPAPDIKFEIPGNSSFPTITLSSGLVPVIVNNVTINGRTQTEYQRFSGLTEGIVVVRGDSYDAHLAHPHTPAVSVGLDILSSGCRVEHLAFYDMETALRLNGKSATGNVIRGCAFLANVEAGVLIEAGAHKNSVGGTEPADRNYFMAQNQAFVVTLGSFGVEIDGNDSDGNLVQGNLIGEGLGSLAAVFGGAAVGMADAGVVIKNGAQGNVVGGRSSKERNVIVRDGTGSSFSIPTFGGISISGAHTDGNLVQGNYIGVDEAGTTAVGNELGIQIQDGAQNNLIGGTDLGAGNVISGNNYNGISINDEGTAHNRIAGNIIGLDALGDTAVPNGDNGIEIHNASDNIIGGTTDASRNVISSSTHDGLHIEGHRNVVQGNYIGTDFTGQFARPNGKAGVFILGGDDNVIGFDTKSTGGNIIAFNTGNGVYIDTAIPSGAQNLAGYRNTIRGNSILGNGKIGIDLKGGHEDASGENMNGLGAADDANEGLNHPSIQVAAVVTGPGNVKTTNVIVHFNDLAKNTKFAFDFYASDLADPSGFGEGAQSLGYIERATVADGSLTFTGSIKGDYFGKVITCTATKKNGADFGSTSEFSNAISVTQQLTLTDDTDAGKYIIFNAATGDYQFYSAGIILKDGTGTISRSGNTVTLTDNKPDRKVKAQADISTNTGTATCQPLPGTTVISINDSH